MNTVEREKLVWQMKTSEQGAATGNIEVKNFKGDSIGSLQPLTEELCKQEDLIARIARWRNKHKKSFFTQTQTTEVETSDWLMKEIIKNNSRILFLILDGMVSLLGVSGWIIYPRPRLS